MLHTITSITDEIVNLLKDDPVRPEIPVTDRVNSNSRIYMLKDGDQTRAVTCVKFLDAIPAAVDDLVELVGSAKLRCFTQFGRMRLGQGVN